MERKHNEELVSRARSLRKAMTKEERRLWYDFLRHYPIRFTRQKILGRYIADFHCSKADLIIELDGSQHYFPQGASADQLRTEYLQQYHLRVLRIPNCAVTEDFAAVCTYIDRAVKQALRQKEALPKSK